MKYSVAEFRQNTRKILNEALQHPVTITRFDEEFVISNAAQTEQYIVKNKTPGLSTQIIEAKTVVGVDNKGKTVSMSGELPDGTYGILADERGLKFCKSGHVKPPNRDKCETKGCFSK